MGSNGDSPLTLSTLADSGKYYAAAGVPESITNKLRRLHAGRLGGISKVMRNGGTLAEVAWATGHKDLVMVLR